jgi:hypothetical protein
MSRPQAGMAELVDAPDLGSGIARCAGSSPVPGTFAKTFGVELGLQFLEITIFSHVKAVVIS